MNHFSSADDADEHRLNTLSLCPLCSLWLSGSTTSPDFSPGRVAIVNIFAVNKLWHYFHYDIIADCA